MFQDRWRDSHRNAGVRNQCTKSFKRFTQKTCDLLESKKMLDRGA